MLCAVVVVSAGIAPGARTETNRGAEGRGYCLFRVSVDKRSAPRSLNDDHAMTIIDLSPDGRHVLLGRSGRTIAVADVDGSHERVVVSASTSGHGAWSPNGRRVAFQVWVRAG
jgi:hypothetical protein